MDVGRLKFDAQGLIPAVVQDWRDGTVLMVAFMNQEALQKTIETKSVHFWSRSRQTYGKRVRPPVTGCSSRTCFSIVTAMPFS